MFASNLRLSASASRSSAPASPGPTLGAVSGAVLVGLLAACGATSRAVDNDVKQIRISIDVDDRHQTLEGFGAAIAWYDDWLTQHPNKAELYDVIFGDLGIDILRLRNRFRYQESFAVESAEIVREGSRSLGRDLKVLMSSWSPPADLKASGQEDCNEQERATCTLKRSDGEFPYARFADYWSDALDAYAELDIAPTFISLQNEPNFHPPFWEGCYFSETESSDWPGYAEALDAVTQRFAQRAQSPKILGPETAGLQDNQVQDYVDALDSSQLAGIAHHLYSGGNWQAPDSYAQSMRSLHRTYPDLPIFQTEFSPDGGDAAAFEMAWLIHNALVEADAAAYVYWDLIWDDDGLVAVENPYLQGDWQTERGYQIRPNYYALRHFAKFTDPGFVRVGAVSSADAIKVSAYLAPDADELTLVILNVSELLRNVSIDIGLAGFQAELIMTTADAAWQDLGSFEIDDELALPGRGIATIHYSR